MHLSSHQILMKERKDARKFFQFRQWDLRKDWSILIAKTQLWEFQVALIQHWHLLVTARAFDKLNLDRKGIIAVTMPGFGTTDRTYTNAVSMIEKNWDVTFKEVNIS